MSESVRLVSCKNTTAAGTILLRDITKKHETGWPLDHKKHRDLIFFFLNTVD